MQIQQASYRDFEESCINSACRTPYFNISGSFLLFWKLQNEGRGEWNAMKKMILLIQILRIALLIPNGPILLVRQWTVETLNSDVFDVALILRATWKTSRNGVGRSLPTVASGRVISDGRMKKEIHQKVARLLSERVVRRGTAPRVQAALTDKADRRGPATVESLSFHAWQVYQYIRQGTSAKKSKLRMGRKDREREQGEKHNINEGGGWYCVVRI